MIEFGRNPNQIRHTFRHTDAEGLQRDQVRDEITRHLRAVEAVLNNGAYTANVQVEGVRLEFRAYKFSDDSGIHVGRITLL